MARRRYDDKFRASAIVMLEAAGYPDRKGALTDVAGHLGISHQLLSNWARGKDNPVPQDVLQEKGIELKDLLRKEINAAVTAMASARRDASYRDLGTVIGILVDKLQLLEGKPTERTEQNVNVQLTDEDRASRIAALLDRGRARRTGQPAHTDD